MLRRDWSSHGFDVIKLVDMSNHKRRYLKEVRGLSVSSSNKNKERTLKSAHKKI